MYIYIAFYIKRLLLLLLIKVYIVYCSINTIYINLNFNKHILLLSIKYLIMLT